MADDIKIKLGLDIADLIQGLNKAIADLNKLIVVADKADAEVSQIGNEKVEVDTTEAVNNLEKLSNKTEETSKGFSGFAAGFGGGLAASGLSMLSEGIVSIAGKIKDGALAADEFGDTLEVAFTQQGIADVEGEINKVRTSTLNLANDLGLPTERTRELASTVATMGGVAGSQAEELTKLSAGLEVFSGGAVKGEAVALAFSKGLADPEGAAAIEKLAKKYPQLAETLRSNIEPAEKMRQANLLLGDSFKTVADQQGDAGGSINKLQNQLGEAFQTIGAGVYDALGPIISDLLPILQEGIPKAMAFMIQAFGTIQTALSTVFGVVQPVLSFMYNNFDAISKVVGVAAIAFTAYSVVTATGAAVTAAYAAVQTALGGSISIATVAQYAWNLAMSLNPIGAVVAALALLGAGIYAVTDALSVSAEETREQAEANVEMIKTQKDANEEQTKAVQSTKTMAEEFLNLSKKKKLTADETKRLKELNGELNKEYPDLVKNTSSYKDNLDGVESIANRAGKSLDNLSEQSIKLDKALQKANQTLAFSKRNESLEALADELNNVFGVAQSVEAKAGAAFATSLYSATTAEQAGDAYSKAIANIQNPKAHTAITAAYNSQIAALSAFKTKAEEVVVVNKKIATSTAKTGGGTAKEVATDLEKAIAEYQKYYLKLEVERTAYNLTLEGSEDEQSKLKEQRLKDDAKLQQAQLNTTFAKVAGTKYQTKLSIVANVNRDESEDNVKKAYQDIFKKNKDILDKGSAIKPTVDKDAAKDVEDFYKKLAESIGEQTKGNATLIKEIIPEIGALTNQELQEVTGNITQLQDVIQGQLQALRDQLAAAQIAGADKAAELFQKQIDEQQKNLDALRLADENYRDKSQESIKKNTLEYQVSTALQTSMLDVFNSDKIRKEKEANDKIREERLGALNSEEDDITKSLAKREISFEDYAAKIADIDAQRKQVEEQTEVTALQRLKTVGDQTAASVFKSQSEIFKKNAEGMEGNQKVFNEFVGQTLASFGELAASGKATLADFGAAVAGAAFDAVAKMIPSFVVGILGSSITTLGPIFGPLAAAALTGTLYGLLGLARSAVGFKDGVVGLEGPGDERSDSIPAWLSKGESVITAPGTKANREELEWMNNNPGMSIKDYFTSNGPQVRYSVQEDGKLIAEVRKLREETRGLGKQINRNTHVEISGSLIADNNSIKAVIERDRRRNARRG